MSTTATRSAWDDPIPLAQRDARVLERHLNQDSSHQNWELDGIYALAGGFHRPYDKATDFKLRVQIIRNAYEQQSYAVVKVWSPNFLKWETIGELPRAEMKVLGDHRGMKVVSYTSKELEQEGIEAFAADELALLLMAEKVLL